MVDRSRLEDLRRLVEIYRAALALAPNDPDLASVVKQLHDQQSSGRLPDPPAADSRARTIAVLDQWLTAIYVTRAQRRS